MTAEEDLARFWAEAMAFPIIPCDLCGSQDGLQRNAMKAMLADMEAKMPGRKEIMLKASAGEPVTSARIPRCSIFPP